MMKQFFRKTMKNIATYVELVLSAFLVFVIAILIIKLVGQCFFDIWHDKLELEYYMEYAMSLAIGVEFVKMLCTHQPGTIIEVLLFATARQMIVEHLNVYETLVGIGAIAALFTIRKFLFCSFDEADHMICRGSQTVAHANLITALYTTMESFCRRREEKSRAPVIISGQGWKRSAEDRNCPTTTRTNSSVRYLLLMDREKPGTAISMMPLAYPLRPQNS